MSMRFLLLIMAIRSWLVNVKAAKAAAAQLFPMTQKLRLSCSNVIKLISINAVQNIIDL